MFEKRLSYNPKGQPMQATTFGSFPAAETLTAALELLGDRAVSRKVSRLLQDLNTGLGHIEGITDARYRGRLTLLWRDDCLRRADIHPAIDKFVRNVICSHAKPLLSGDGDVPSDGADTYAF